MGSQVGDEGFERTGLGGTGRQEILRPGFPSFFPDYGHRPRCYHAEFHTAGRDLDEGKLYVVTDDNRLADPALNYEHGCSASRGCE
jgi:hypothetical protein